VEAVEHYLDASVLIALLTPERLSDRAERFIRTHPTGLIVSDFAAAEFASANRQTSAGAGNDDR